MDIVRVEYTVARQSSGLLASGSHLMVCSSQTGQAPTIVLIAQYFLIHIDEFSSYPLCSA